MAAGDVFSDHYFPATTAGVDVQPAAGVQVMITFITANTNNTRLVMKNSSGSFNAYVPTGTASSDAMTDGRINFNMKLFLTNSEYIQFKPSSGTYYFAYSGIEI